jgi:peroxiredoxin
MDLPGAQANPLDRPELGAGRYSYVLIAGQYRELSSSIHDYVMKKRWNANTWVVVILFTLIGLISIDIARQMVRSATEKPEPPPPPTKPDPDFKVGDLAPDFSLPDAKGKRVQFSKVAKGDSMLWFTCGCSNCLEVQEYMSTLSQRLGKRAPSIVNVTTMEATREAAWLKDSKLAQTILYEPDARSPVGMMYKGHPCPRFFRITPERKVAAIGPSPSTLPDMRMMSMMLADTLGFKRQADAKAGDMVAPEPKIKAKVNPPGTTSVPIDQPPSSNPAHVPGNGAAQPAASQKPPDDGHGHSAGDGHNH